MRAYVIECRRGFVALPEIICSYRFPLSFVTLSDASPLPSRAVADSRIKKYKLTQGPFHAHVQVVDINGLGKITLAE
jgi:hypothetical protein